MWSLCPERADVQHDEARCLKRRQDVVLSIAWLLLLSAMKRAFFGGNAADFLGPRADSQLRQRIERFYRDNSVTPTPS